MFKKSLLHLSHLFILILPIKSMASQDQTCKTLVANSGNVFFLAGRFVKKFKLPLLGSDHSLEVQLSFVEKDLSLKLETEEILVEQLHEVTKSVKVYRGLAQNNYLTDDSDYKVLDDLLLKEKLIKAHLKETRLMLQTLPAANILVSDANKLKVEPVDTSLVLEISFLNNSKFENASDLITSIFSDKFFNKIYMRVYDQFANEQLYPFSHRNRSYSVYSESIEIILDGIPRHHILNFTQELEQELVKQSMKTNIK